VNNHRILNKIRTHKHIRTMRSTRVNTGPGRHAWWPRLRETERLAREAKRRQARRCPFSE
jgi:hypothetical protein